jgi:hypothetical protein
MPAAEVTEWSMYADRVTLDTAMAAALLVHMDSCGVNDALPDLTVLSAAVVGRLEASLYLPAAFKFGNSSDRYGRHGLHMRRRLIILAHESQDGPMPARKRIATRVQLISISVVLKPQSGISMALKDTGEAWFRGGGGYVARAPWPRYPARTAGFWFPLQGARSLHCVSDL